MFDFERKNGLEIDDDFDDAGLVAGIHGKRLGGFFQGEAMRDQARKIDCATLVEIDGTRVDVFHAAREANRHPLAADGGVLERDLVGTGNADDDHAPADARHVGGLLDGLVGPGSFDGDIDAATVGGAADDLRSIGEISVDRNTAQFFGEFETPGKFVADENRRSAGEFCDLQNQQTDGSRADDGGGVTDVNAGEIDGMQGHSERFEQRGFAEIHVGGNRKAAAGGHEHGVAEGAIVRVRTTKVDIAAEIGMAVLAVFAMPARLGRVDGDVSADGERHFMTVEGVGSDCFDDAAELMAEDERAFEGDIADASVEIGVEIAAADANAAVSDQDLPRPRLAGRREVFKSQISRAVKSNRSHEEGVYRMRPGLKIGGGRVRKSRLSRWMEYAMDMAKQSSTGRRAVFPGQFDPITNGHLEVIRRGLAIFDEIIVAVGINPDKRGLFSLDEREEMIRKLLKDIPKSRVMKYSGLTAHFVKQVKATAILRGIRDVSDLRYEFQLALANRAVGGIETVFIMTGDEYALTSSSLIRQVVALGGDVSSLSAVVPPLVVERLRDKQKSSKRLRESVREEPPI